MTPAPATRIAITGGSGFLGWHAACRLRALHGVEAIRLGRPELADPAALDDALGRVDAVFHLAGVNRAETDEQVEQGNIELAETLAEALGRQPRPLHVVYANSIQAILDNPYGRGKRRAGELLAKAVAGAGGRFTDLLLPNLFGEHGRPAYNSFVATFANEVAHGRPPQVTGDRQVPLMHAQDAAEAMIQAVLSGATGQQALEGLPVRVTTVLMMLDRMHELYSLGEVPPLTTPFEVNLFNTYRAFRFPEMFPIAPQVHADQRGALVETVRSHGGTGQSFVSTTVPGEMRGDHYHLHKVERFFVLKGEAEISLRRLLHDDPDEIVTFRLSGDRPAFVDMPTLWVHNIRNVGDTELLTVFWADQLLDPDNPDQFPERVSTGPTIEETR
jgi:UDP-2-acetamido-2,6-beta-L-arabino-hexul-4-ose reductase